MAAISPILIHHKFSTSPALLVLLVVAMTTNFPATKQRIMCSVACFVAFITLGIFPSFLPVSASEEGATTSTQSKDKDKDKDDERWRGPEPSIGRLWPEGEGHLFLRHWFQMGEGLPNPMTNGRFRVNDPFVATHPTFHARNEPKGNGLMLIPVKVPMRDVQAARLYLELWGGHPHSNNRRVSVNGRTTYAIQLPNEAHCTHAYRNLQLQITDLVQGLNAIQFNVDGEHTFWGHFIVEEASIDILVEPTHPLSGAYGIEVGPMPSVNVQATDNESFELS